MPAQDLVYILTLAFLTSVFFRPQSPFFASLAARAVCLPFLLSAACVRLPALPNTSLTVRAALARLAVRRSLSCLLFFTSAPDSAAKRAKSSVSFYSTFFNLKTQKLSKLTSKSV
jgi:hypothetical protein